jgi:hypothetical protein
MLHRLIYHKAGEGPVFQQRKVRIAKVIKGKQKDCEKDCLESV